MGQLVTQFGTWEQSTNGPLKSFYKGHKEKNVRRGLLNRG